MHFLFREGDFHKDYDRMLTVKVSGPDWIFSQIPNFLSKLRGRLCASFMGNVTLLLHVKLLSVCGKTLKVVFSLVVADEFHARSSGWHSVGRGPNFHWCCSFERQTGKKRKTSIRLFCLTRDYCSLFCLFSLNRKSCLNRKLIMTCVSYFMFLFFTGICKTCIKAKTTSSRHVLCPMWVSYDWTIDCFVSLFCKLGCLWAF